MRPAAIIWSLLFPGSLMAQGICLPPTSSNEAKTMAILSVPVAFTGRTGGMVPSPGDVVSALRDLRTSAAAPGRRSER